VKANDLLACSTHLPWKDGSYLHGIEIVEEDRDVRIFPCHSI
jgi:hypothetical protein